MQRREILDYLGETSWHQPHQEFEVDSIVDQAWLLIEVLYIVHCDTMD